MEITVYVTYLNEPYAIPLSPILQKDFCVRDFKRKLLSVLGLGDFDVKEYSLYLRKVNILHKKRLQYKLRDHEILLPILYRDENERFSINSIGLYNLELCYNHHNIKTETSKSTRLIPQYQDYIQGSTQWIPSPFHILSHQCSTTSPINFRDNLFEMIGKYSIIQGSLQRQVPPSDSWKDQYFYLTPNQLWFHSIVYINSTKSISTMSTSREIDINTTSNLQLYSLPLDRQNLTISYLDSSKQKLKIQYSDDSSIVLQSHNEKIITRWFEALLSVVDEKNSWNDEDNESFVRCESQISQDVQRSFYEDDYKRITSINYLHSGIMTNPMLRKFLFGFLRERGFTDLIDLWILLQDFHDYHPCNPTYQTNVKENKVTRKTIKDIQRRYEAIVRDYIEDWDSCLVTFLSSTRVNYFKQLYHITSLSALEVEEVKEVEDTDDQQIEQVFDYESLSDDVKNQNFMNCNILNELQHDIELELGKVVNDILFDDKSPIQDKSRKVLLSSLYSQQTSPSTSGVLQKRDSNKSFVGDLMQRMQLGFKSSSSNTKISRIRSIGHGMMIQGQINELNNWKLARVKGFGLKASELWWRRYVQSINVLDDVSEDRPVAILNTPSWFPKRILETSELIFDDITTCKTTIEQLNPLIDALGTIVRFGFMDCRFYYHTRVSSTDEIFGVVLDSSSVAVEAMPMKVAVDVKSTTTTSSSILSNLQSAFSEPKRQYALLVEKTLFQKTSSCGLLILLDPLTWEVNVTIDLTSIRHCRIHPLNIHHFDLYDTLGHSWELKPSLQSNDLQIETYSTSSSLHSLPHSLPRSSFKGLENEVIDLQNPSGFNTIDYMIFWKSSILKYCIALESNDKLLRCGYLSKRGLNNRAFKRRFFVLITNQLKQCKLRYYNGIGVNFKGEIDLRKVTSVSCVYDNQNSSSRQSIITPSLKRAITSFISPNDDTLLFQLNQSQRTWELKGESVHETNEWVNILRHCLQLMVQVSADSNSSAPHEIALDSTSDFDEDDED